MKQEIIKKLQSISLFETVRDEAESLELLANMMELRTYKKGSFIIKEGDEGDEMFILYKGTVEIGKNTLSKESYTVVKLSAKDNAFFGELALVDDDRRSASVIADSDCELLVINKRKFLQIGNSNNRLGLLVTRKISEILSQRLRRGNQDIITLFEALVGEIEESA